MQFFIVLLLLFVVSVPKSSVFFIEATNHTCNLPCLPCANGAVCDGQARFTNSDGQIFGVCNCTGTGYVGDQCTRPVNASCAIECLHGGVCVGGICQCPSPYGGTGCRNTMCVNLVGGVDKLPTSAGECFGDTCNPGYGEWFCRSKVDSRACASSERFASTLYTTEPFRHLACHSEDIGWKALLGGSSTVFSQCYRPDGWNSTTPGGWCTMDFYRNATATPLIEELFTCNFTKCVLTAAGSIANTMSSQIVEFGALSVTEPGLALALRILLFLSAVAVAVLTVFGDRIASTGIISPIALMVVVVLLILNLSVGAHSYANANKKNVVAYELPSGDDVLLEMKCMESKCTCLPSILPPNCASAPSFSGLVLGLTKTMRLTCNDKTRDCTFVHEDLGGFNIGMNCDPVDCRTALDSTDDLARATIPKENKNYASAIVVAVLAGIVLLAMVVSIVMHFVHLKNAEKEWLELLDQFEVEMKNSAAARGPVTTSASKAGENGTAATSVPIVAAAGVTNDGTSSNFGPGASIRVANVKYIVQALTKDTMVEQGSGEQTKTQLEILKGVSHTFQGGEVTAIMGPSGCGKTTLLDILCSREKAGEVNGEIYVQNNVMGSQPGKSAEPGWEHITPALHDTFHRLISYVADDDVILPTLTVTEALFYACELRQPVLIPFAEKMKFIDRLVSMFRLQHCRHTVIGAQAAADDSSSGGLSQGERRRTTIAMHLAALPRVLILDEPTTGLDSFNARLVIQALHAACHLDYLPLSSSNPTADDGRKNAPYDPYNKFASNISNSIYHDYYPAYYHYRPTIILSIHQPSLDLLQMFDSIVLMAKGNIVYAGPVHDEKLEGFIEQGLRYLSEQHQKKKNEGKETKKEEANNTRGETNEEADYEKFVRAVSPTTSPVPSPSHGDRNQQDENAVFQERKFEPGASSPTLNVIPLPDRLLLFAALYDGPAMVVSENEAGAPNKPIVAFSDAAERQPYKTPPATHQDDVTHTSSSSASPLMATQRQIRFMPPFWTQCKILTIRGWMHLVRRKDIFALHYLVASIVALMISFMYESSDRDVPGTLSKAGALTFYLLWIGVINLSALDLLLSERGTFVFERNAACYSAGAYFLTKLFLDILVLRMIPTALSGTLLYFPIGLKPDVGAFGNFICVTILFSITTAALSILIASLAPSFGTGLLLNGFALIILFAFGGFISQESLIPGWLKWIKYVSPFNFAFETILVRDLEGQLCTFIPRDSTGEPTAAVTITLQCEQYLYNLGLKPENVPLDISLLIIWGAVYLILTFVVLNYFVRGRR